jgi:NADPH:quinone reductase-like Zn-dependent oxidoreductase
MISTTNTAPVQRRTAVSEVQANGSDASAALEGGSTRRTHGDAKMRAIIQHTYGTAEVLEVAEIDRPSIGDDEVLIRVQAAAMDRGTWHLMTGTPYAARLAVGLRSPKNPIVGRDVSGVVVGVGRKVTRFIVGDEVYGVANGSFAEFATAQPKKLAMKPSNLSFTEAAAVPISGLTALGGVCNVGRLRAGQRVLVIGASGGVGTFAVQIAKASGATVTGVCSGGKMDLVRSIGADRVIDYTTTDFADGAERYDLIVDIAGNTSLSRLRRALQPSGMLVIVGGENAGRWLGLGRQFRAVALSPFVRQRLAILFPNESGTELERLTALIEAGQVRPSIDRVYRLDEVPEAMRKMEAGTIRGKAVIQISPDAVISTH